MEIEVLAIEIDQEPIELYKLLKIANLVGGGGEAKMMISEGYVFLNGEVEFQKRKKVYADDIVQFNGEAIMPILAEYRASGIAGQENTMPADPRQNTEPTASQQTVFDENPTAKSQAKQPQANASARRKNDKRQQNKSTNNKNASSSGKGSSKDKRTGRKSITF
ncbi:RNA-binding S4 domain-containing protein [Thalassotalea maritima]|uniref:RNA-binding S4 domain-containing protein n=1 Tax=Thalassotalea maritima TaxID=3242416 RepID=UPI00352869CB